jgi:hypothetical protein
VPHADGRLAGVDVGDGEAIEHRLTPPMIVMVVEVLMVSGGSALRGMPGVGRGLTLLIVFRGRKRLFDVPPGA